MQSTERRPFPHRRGLIIVTTLATAYVASHFFRASNVTIGLDLMRDLAIGPEALGALTGAFFFGFAAMQIPCGFLFDHFGPRRTVAGMLILATIGGAIFTLAPTWPILLTGRVLMGAGFGVMLIGSMVVISRWFPPDRFSTSPPWCCRSACSAICRHHAAGLGLAGHRLARRVRRRRRLHRARHHRRLAGGARRAARPSLPGPHAGAATPDAARPDGGAAQPAPEADPGAEFLQLCLHLHRAGPVGRSVPARGAWPEPDRGRQRPARAVIAYQIGMLAFGPLDRLLDTRKWIAIGGTW
jgi:hypothetical protein